MKTVFILMDSLNRHYLNAYGESWIQTPNLDRLFKKGVRFDRHYSCSLPCMPARRDLFTGRMTFLEAPWGSLEPWDCSLPRILRENGVYTHMITDHYHYFEGGGAGYYQAFDSWELERGQEGDVWHPLVRCPDLPEYKGKNRRAYWVNRSFAALEDEEDYPTQRCFRRAMEFLDNNHMEDDWHLHLEVFDPHEPFMCPKEYLDMYGDDWQGYHFDWPNYAAVTEGEEAVEHIRRGYAAVLTMADKSLGHFLDKMDEYGMWEGTTLILTTDHGHLLGEHGYWAKNYTFDYEELTHIPLCVVSPGSAGKDVKTIGALTSAIDLMPTILDLHGVCVPESVHGQSVLPLLDDDSNDREGLLFGYFGKDINLVTEKYSYCRQPLPNSHADLFTLCTDTREGFIDEAELASAELGHFLPHAGGTPQLKIKKKSKRHADAPEFNLIYDIKSDPRQQNPIHDRGLERQLSALMRRLLVKFGAPASQLERTGLIEP